MSNYPKYPYTNFHELNADWVLDQAKTAVAEAKTAVEEVKYIRSAPSGVGFDEFGFAFRMPNEAERMAIDNLPQWAKDKIGAERLQRVYFNIFYNEDAMGNYFITGTAGGFPVNVEVKTIVRWELFVGIAAGSTNPTYYKWVNGSRPGSWGEERVFTPEGSGQSAGMCSGYWWGADMKIVSNQLPFIMTDFKGQFFESGGNPIYSEGQSAFPYWPFASWGTCLGNLLQFPVTQYGILAPYEYDLTGLINNNTDNNWGLKGVITATVNSMYKG